MKKLQELEQKKKINLGKQLNSKANVHESVGRMVYQLDVGPAQLVLQY